MKAVCPICPHACSLSPGQTGLCRARQNVNGEIRQLTYGKLTSIALDPIEKKPLARFMPGSMILSVGSYGCNLTCGFCQNHRISLAAESPHTISASPQALVYKAQELTSDGNIGIAYTYNEPLIGYEYVCDCAHLAASAGLKNVLVTNGYVNEKPLLALLQDIHAMNIDLKGFNDAFYRSIGGSLEPVKRTIALASKQTHVEVTTLIIPKENDSEREMEELSLWLSLISDEIPLHISRFFPQHLYAQKSPTPVDAIYRLAEIARRHLRYVYTGNC